MVAISWQYSTRPTITCCRGGQRMTTATFIVWHQEQGCSSPSCFLYQFVKVKHGVKSRQTKQNNMIISQLRGPTIAPVPCPLTAKETLVTKSLFLFLPPNKVKQLLVLLSKKIIVLFVNSNNSFSELLFNYNFVVFWLRMKLLDKKLVKCIDK